ncbi:unnamed protein product [Diplocarpon coronariae]
MSSAAQPLSRPCRGDDGLILPTSYGGLWA